MDSTRIPLPQDRRWLLDLARKAGDRWFDPNTGLCIIARDTYWYALALLLDADEAHRSLGRSLLCSLSPKDATHTPATLLAMLHHMSGALDAEIVARMEEDIGHALVGAATCEMHDGNVNHPLAAYATLILGGERCGQDWAVELGVRRLHAFRERIGDHVGRCRRQSEMSEYNSLTYTALDLWFLALIAADARSSAARATALFLEQRLWINVAMHFHAPSQQFAGPHSRSYADDSIGGCSALHFTMAAAFGDPLYIEPDLCVRYNHPSTLVQNALVAIVPFHVPAEARVIAWRKPFPYEIRLTTYGESYHENSRRQSDVQTAGKTRFAFDEEVYPGGWSDQTTFMTRDYALGTASLPYVNAGHADSFMLRIRRHETIRSLADFRSAYTRGVFNGARIGEKNFCHVAQTAIDESYLYEEGRSAIYQHNDAAIVCYTPKRAGHAGLKSFRVDLLFTYHAPFDALLVNGEHISEFPREFPSATRLWFRDDRTFGCIMPLSPSPQASARPFKLWRCGDYLVFSMVNYEGPERDFSRHDLNSWWSGFVLTLSSSGETEWETFMHVTGAAHVEQTVHDGSLRTVRFTCGCDTMAFTYDPFKEVVVSRLWNGVEDSEQHFRVEAGGSHEGVWCPQSLYGHEVVP